MKDDWISKIRHNEKQHWSQGTQDGVIEYIIKHIPIKHKFCVEFGFNSTNWDDCLPNTKHLVMNYQWDYLLLDGSCENKVINLHKHFITSENICDLFDRYDVPKEPGFISIDLDTTDIWIADKLLENYHPSFFSIEFNPNFPIDVAMAFPNNSNELWHSDRVMGSSLHSIYLMAKNHDYVLVYAGNYKTSKHHDAFFIKSDLIGNLKPPDITSFSDTFFPLHEVCINGREKIYLNYNVWLQTKNTELSRSSVPKKWRKYITGNIFQRLKRKQKLFRQKFSI